MLECQHRRCNIRVMRKASAKKDTPRTLELRDRLKSIVEAELDRLPSLLNGLKDKERLAVLLKLMPLVLPKAKPVNHWVSEDDLTAWRQFGRNP